MKVYIANKSHTAIGGGWRFLENLRKGLDGLVEFVETWQESDIVFIFSISAIDKGELHEAHKSGKRLILRVDNIPRKSRNKGQSPVERLTEFGAIADYVVYQSRWCQEYAGYFIPNNRWTIINNGVDIDIFNMQGRSSDGKTCLYINYNDNPNKRFDEALYWFDKLWRADHEYHLWIAGNAPTIYQAHPEFNWDLPVPAKVDYMGVPQNAQTVAAIMKKCDILLYPSFAEAYPNTVLEAMACGLSVRYVCNEGGTKELIDNNRFTPKTIQQMGQEYLNIFNFVMHAKV